MFRYGRKIAGIVFCFSLQSISHCVFAEVIDPMRPFGAVVEDGEAVAGSSERNQPIVLQAVFLTGAAGVAVINGRVYEIGEYVSGARLKRIENDGVILQKNGRDTYIRLVGDLW